VAETVEVVRIEFYSKLAALDALARHLGMGRARPRVETVPAPPAVDVTAQLLDRLTAAGRQSRRSGRRAA
jgi:hypothetical protein